MDRLAPLVIWIHGGGWRVGDKRSIASFPGPSSSPPQRTNCRDIVQVQVPDLATLIAKGYAVASMNYRLDLDPVAAVQDAPNVSSAVQAVVDWYGATEFPDLPGRHVPAEDPFPYTAGARSLPPFRIAHGDADCVVPVQHSRDLETALRQAGAVSTLVILHGAGHEDPAFMRTQSAPTIAFLDQALHQ